MKEQDKTTEKELNKMGTSNLPVAEFKTLAVLCQVAQLVGALSCTPKKVVFDSPSGHIPRL